MKYKLWTSNYNSVTFVDGSSLRTYLSKNGRIGIRVWDSGGCQWFSRYRHSKLHTIPADIIWEWVDENNVDLNTDEGEMAFLLRWC